MHALHATCGISVFLEGMGAAMVSGALACGWAVVLHLACGGAAMVDAGLQSKMLSTVCAKQSEANRGAGATCVGRAAAARRP